MCKPNEVENFNKEFRKEANKMLKSKEEVKKFLIDAGILTTKGTLREIYR